MITLQKIKVSLSVFCFVLISCAGDPVNVVEKEKKVGKRFKNEPITPIIQSKEIDSGKVKLGRLLFHEKKLSGNNTISCASCHDLKKGGSDGAMFSTGIYGRTGMINSPTVYNSVNNFRQFWDGRSPNLFDQIDGPIHNELEMGSNWNEVINKLSKDPLYVEKFNALFDNGITTKNVKTCIEEFEKNLVTPSRFDRYLLGDNDAISFTEKKGYKLFKSYGCISCHQGQNVGGNMYQKFGVVNDYFEDRGYITESDYGKYNVTKKEEDRYYFKVPTLRNVALTAPYFHDGRTQTLTEAIKIMAKYQIGRPIPEEEVDQIASFLHSLTGDSLLKYEN